MPIFSTSYADLLESGLRQMFHEAYASTEAMAAQLFNNAFTTGYVYEDPVVKKLIRTSRRQGKEEHQVLKRMYKKVYS